MKDNNKKTKAFNHQGEVEIAPYKLPYNIDLEQVLLGGVMNANESYYKISDIVPEDFYEPLHQKIWQYMVHFIEKGLPITPVTLKPYFEQDPACTEAGGARYFLSLCSIASGMMNHQQLAEELKSIARKRSLAGVLEKYIPNGVTAATDIEAMFAEIDEIGVDNKNAFLIRSSAQVAYDIYESLKEDLPCFSTGIMSLDKAMGGGAFGKKTYCFAAPQKVGKTVVLASISYNMTKLGIPHMFIAAEMGNNEILQRCIAHDLGRNSLAFYDHNIRSSNTFQQEIADFALAEENKAGQTKYVDAPSITFAKLRHLIISAARRYKVKGVFLDYLQIVTGMAKGENESQFQGRVAQWLAEIARKENIFIIYAAQLNREGQLRGSDGIKNAVDQLYMIRSKLNQVKDSGDRWMDLEASRYTIKASLGSETEPRFKIDKKAGPFLVELDSQQYDENGRPI